MRVIDLTGQTFGRLLVIARILPNVNHTARWCCRCTCGREIVVQSSGLRMGRTKSCGCLRVERTQLQFTTHGYSDKTPEYFAWKAMIQRCTDSRRREWMHYGGRGITVCAEWRHDFMAFLAHVGPRPSLKHSLDRINNNGNYEPGNVRWATRSQQMKNRRPTITRRVEEAA